VTRAAAMVGSGQVALDRHGDVIPASVSVQVEAADHGCVTLPSSLMVVALLDHAVDIRVSGVERLMRSGDRATLSAGTHCISFDDVVRRTMTFGTLGGETSATPAYMLTFWPVP
jgi:hypothetical protein